MPAHYGVHSGGKRIARITLSGDKITCDNQNVEQMYIHKNVLGKTVEDGPDFFYALPALFRSGYITLEVENDEA